MTTRSIVHATFTLEKKLKSAPAKVFHAFADPKAGAQLGLILGRIDGQLLQPPFVLCIGGLRLVQEPHGRLLSVVRIVSSP